MAQSIINKKSCNLENNKAYKLSIILEKIKQKIKFSLFRSLLSNFYFDHFTIISRTSRYCDLLNFLQKWPHDDSNHLDYFLISFPKHLAYLDHAFRNLLIYSNLQNVGRVSCSARAISCRTSVEKVIGRVVLMNFIKTRKFPTPAP